MDENKLEIIKKIVSSFSKTVKVEDLDQSSDEARRANNLGDLFTGGVQILKSWPDKTISSLGDYIWDIFHNRYANVGVGPNVPTVSTAIVPPSLLVQMGFPAGVEHECVVFLPYAWQEMIREKPLLQLGAILFAGSQAADFYNKRHKIDPENISLRAQMYEGVYLKMLDPEKLDEYQKIILERYNGELVPEFLYDRKPVEMVS
jgi:hypothetical protein